MCHWQYPTFFFFFNLSNFFQLVKLEYWREVCVCVEGRPLVSLFFFIGEQQAKRNFIGEGLQQKKEIRCTKSRILQDNALTSFFCVFVLVLALQGLDEPSCAVCTADAKDVAE